MGKSSFHSGLISTYAFRYEIRRLEWNISKVATIGCGVGLNPYYLITEYKSNHPNHYSRKEKILGTSINLIPGLNIDPGSRWQFHFSIPLKVYDIAYYKMRVYNPNFSIDQQTQKNVDISSFTSAFTARLGASYTL